MRKLRSFLSLILTAAAVLSLAACSTAGSAAAGAKASVMPSPTPETIVQTAQPPLIILFVHAADMDSTTHAAALKFQELVEKASDGEMRVEVYPNAMLGGFDSMKEGLRRGILHVGCGAFLDQPYDDCPVFCIPNLFPDMETVYALSDLPEVKEAANLQLAKKGTELLAIIPDSFRMMTSSESLASMEDLQRLSIRVMLHNSICLSYWEMLGARPGYCSAGELFPSLQQGVFTAQEGPLSTLVSTQLYKLQKYVLLTRHQVYFQNIFISRAFFESLTDEQRALIMSVMPAVKEYAIKNSQTAETDALRTLAAAGVVVAEPPEGCAGSCGRRLWISSCSRSRRRVPWRSPTWF
jgi:TRAP-type C4-dicarboxylate transport system substrate-binding protein